MDKSRIILFVILLAAPMGASAATVVTAPCINDADAVCATAIQGLIVAGVTLHVSFAGGSFDDAYGDVLPYFAGDEPGAQLAAIAIADALTLNSIDGVIGNGMASDRPDTVRIPFRVFEEPAGTRRSSGILVYTPSLDATFWSTMGEYSGITSFDPTFPGDYDHWALFTVVPIPSGIWLLLPALALTASLRREA